MASDRRLVLMDKAVTLVVEANALWERLPSPLVDELGRLVRSMNCYYSNLIEGHPTHPVDIDRALAGNLSAKPEQRNLQLEAVAHIAVQTMIDEGLAPSPTLSVRFIKWAHREFCQRLPEEMLWVINPETGKRSQIVPGEFRREHVAVGRHIPPEASLVEDFLARLFEGYQLIGQSRVQRPVAVAASHHRLLWVHPFLDGNGRVARLFSHALLREWGVGSNIWSVSRGLGRNVVEYKVRLGEADEPRRGDLDGRGALSDHGLERFCSFFLDVCVDQVRFMGAMLKPEELGNRIRRWAVEEIELGRLPNGSWELLREALVSGEFRRGEAERLTGYRERQARTVLNALIGRGVLTSQSPKGPVRLAFGADVVEQWFPTLYPAMVA